MKTRLPLIAAILFAIAVIAAGVVFLLNRFNPFDRRGANVLAFIRNPDEHSGWLIQANSRCDSAPFQFPTTGFPGYLWGDSFRIGHRHQGIDIFGGTQPGETPVYAAYPGYLTREADWKSTVIIRLPDDPLQPGRQVWTYYTHMADTAGNSLVAGEFPPGTREVYVEAGTLLGTMGNYSGTPGNPTGVHLHFSIVLDNGAGGYTNELEIANTLDPSPYFNLPLNGKENRYAIPACDANG